MKKSFLGVIVGMLSLGLLVGCNNPTPPTPPKPDEPVAPTSLKFVTLGSIDTETEVEIKYSVSPQNADRHLTFSDCTGVSIREVEVGNDLKYMIKGVTVGTYTIEGTAKLAPTVKDSFTVKVVEVGSDHYTLAGSFPEGYPNWDAASNDLLLTYDKANAVYKIEDIPMIAGETEFQVIKDNSWEGQMGFSSIASMDPADCMAEGGGYDIKNILCTVTGKYTVELDVKGDSPAISVKKTGEFIPPVVVNVPNKNAVKEVEADGDVKIEPARVEYVNSTDSILLVSSKEGYGFVNFFNVKDPEEKASYVAMCDSLSIGDVVAVEGKVAVATGGTLGKSQKIIVPTSIKVSNEKVDSWKYADAVNSGVNMRDYDPETQVSESLVKFLRDSFEAGDDALHGQVVEFKGVKFLNSNDGSSPKTSDYSYFYTNAKKMLKAEGGKSIRVGIYKTELPKGIQAIDSEHPLESAPYYTVKALVFGENNPFSSDSDTILRVGMICSIEEEPNVVSNVSWEVSVAEDYLKEGEELGIKGSWDWNTTTPMALDEKTGLYTVTFENLFEIGANYEYGFVVSLKGEQTLWVSEGENIKCNFVTNTVNRYSLVERPEEGNGMAIPHDAVIGLALEEDVSNYTLAPHGTFYDDNWSPIDVAFTLDEETGVYEVTLKNVRFIDVEFGIKICEKDTFNQLTENNWIGSDAGGNIKIDCRGPVLIFPFAGSVAKGVSLPVLG